MVNETIQIKTNETPLSGAIAMDSGENNVTFAPPPGGGGKKSAQGREFKVYKEREGKKEKKRWKERKRGRKEEKKGEKNKRK